MIPRDIAARNNRAETLLRLGCRSAAAREIALAQDRARGGALEAAVTDTAARITAAAAGDAADCPAPTCPGPARLKAARVGSSFGPDPGNRRMTRTNTR